MTGVEFLEKILASCPKDMPPIKNAEYDTVEHKVGNFYIVDKDLYILAQTSGLTCALIALEGGNRWNDGIRVGAINHITDEEFARIAPVDRYPIETLTITRR